MGDYFWKKLSLKGISYLQVVFVLFSRRVKCSNTEFFLIRILLHSDWIPRDTPYLSVFSPNAEKYGPEKKSVFGHFSRSVGIKWTLVCFNLQINGTGNELFSIKETFEESFQLQLSVLHQSMCILKTSLSSLSDGWAKYKVKVPVWQIPTKMSKQQAIPNSSL